MPKEYSHQWPFLPAMRSLGRSLSPGGSAPLTLCAAPQLLRSSHRRHHRSARARATVWLPRLGCLRCSALEGAIRVGGGPTWNLVYRRNPGNVKVEKTHIGRFSDGSRGERVKKAGKSGGTEWKYRATSASTDCLWTKKPLYRGSILFSSILFDSIPPNLIGVCYYCFLV